MANDALDANDPKPSSRKRADHPWATPDHHPPTKHGEMDRVTHVVNLEATGLVRSVALADLDPDTTCQPREGLNQETVKAYAEAMEEGVEFPPPVVFMDDGRMKVSDGFHRVAAARRIGREQITVEVRTFDPREATDYALLANNSHGLPLTRREKNAAMTRMLSDARCKGRTDTEIARHCGVSSRTVGRKRARLDSENSTSAATPTARIRTYEKDGKTRTIDTTRLGRKRREPDTPKTATPNGSTAATDATGEARPDLALPTCVEADGTGEAVDLPPTPPTIVAPPGTIAANVVAVDDSANESAELRNLLNALIKCATAVDAIADRVAASKDSSVKSQALTVAQLLTDLAAALLGAADVAVDAAPPSLVKTAKRKSAGFGLFDPLAASREMATAPQ